MPIYYVDTVDGSDANTGASWAQAWKTCYPISALHGASGIVRDIEVRIAKTLPVETNRSITFSNTLLNPTLMCLGATRPYTGFRKTVIPDYVGVAANVPSYGGTVISPFFSNSESAGPYRPSGTFKFRLDAPAGANGRAARWALSYGDFSAFESFELIAAFRYLGSDSPCPGEVWLEFSTDLAGSNIIWSRKFTPGVCQYEARLCLVGNNDLPTGAAYAFLRVLNPTTSTIHLECTSIHAVLPITHPNYYGLREVYVPHDKNGAVLSPSSTSGVDTVFTGIDGAAVDNYLTSQAQPTRTWSVYRWQHYPYAPEALLPTCSIAGSPTTPLKVYGGWNKATGLVDGVSAIDAANIRWFNGVREVSVDVRNVVLACRRTGKVGSGGTPGIMEYTGYGADKRLLGAVADGVYIPAGGPGCVTEVIGYAYADMRRDSLINVPEWGISAGSDATIRNCNTALGVPFPGGVAYSVLEDSAWGMMNVYHSVDGFVAERCRIWEVRSQLTGDDAAIVGKPIIYRDCDVMSLVVSNFFSNEYVAAPRAYMENCRLWGAHTGPISHDYPAKNIQYTPLPGVVGAVCTHGANIDGFSCYETSPTYFTTDSMFARTGYSSDTVKVTMRNANVQMIFANFVPSAGALDYKGHEVTLQNVVLHKTAASVGAPFNSSKLQAKNLTLEGAWAALQGGIIRATEVTDLVVTDATTKIANNFKFAAPATGWGRVCASYRNVVHPLGLDGFLGTPGYGPSSAAAGWFHTLSGEMWASCYMTVRRDTTLSHSGLSSWKIAPLQPIGALSLGSFMVGVIPVAAGVPITFSAVMRRSSTHVLGGIFIRPGITREWTDQSVDDAPALRDIVAKQNTSLAVDQWEIVTASYTPYRDGLVEVHAGVRGLAGSHVWLDTLKVT